MSKHPLDLQPGKKLGKDEVAEALRLSIIAELDAINLYLQIARAVEDERVKKVFEDIAKEEKTHVGEFLAVLKALDAEQVEELRKGLEEVKKLTGIQVNESQNNNVVVEVGHEDILKQVPTILKEFIDKVRVLRKHLPIVKVGRGVESTVIEKLVDGRLERIVESLHELSIKFKVSQRSLDLALRERQSIEMSDAYSAGRKLIMLEEKYLLDRLLNAEGIIRLPLSDWREVGSSVQDVANAIMKLYENGISKPFLLIVSPARYSDLLIVRERTGITELERIKGLVDEVIVMPALPDNYVIVLSPRADVIDVIVGGDAEVDYIGPEDGFHVFRIWETLNIRIKNSKGICVLGGK